MRKLSFFLAFSLSVFLFGCSRDITCPTTSRCGCSDKTKAECEASPDCCKWTTGQGCGCKN
jgi:hypothetical protein